MPNIKGGFPIIAGGFIPAFSAPGQVKGFAGGKATSGGPGLINILLDLPDTNLPPILVVTPQNCPSQFACVNITGTSVSAWTVNLARSDTMAAAYMDFSFLVVGIPNIT